MRAEPRIAKRSHSHGLCDPSGSMQLLSQLLTVGPGSAVAFYSIWVLKAINRKWGPQQWFINCNTLIFIPSWKYSVQNFSNTHFSAFRNFNKTGSGYVTCMWWYVTIHSNMGGLWFYSPERAGTISWIYLEVMMRSWQCLNVIRIVTSVLLLDFIIFSLSGNELAASCELSRCAWIRAAKPTAWLCLEQPMMAELQKLSQSWAKPSSGNTNRTAVTVSLG